MRSPESQPGAAVALITGGSTGLGLEIASTFVAAGYCVAIVARDETKLQSAKEHLLGVAKRTQHSIADPVIAISARLDERSEVQTAIDQITATWGRLDVLVNNVGASDRGTTLQLTAEQLTRIVSANIVPTLLCSQTAFPWLQESKGVIVNIGSLAAKVGARYLGAYPAAKHALAGLTQQMRLEWQPQGVHVGLLNPGPIQRSDAGSRYSANLDADPTLPPKASRPGGGTRVKGLPAATVARRVLRMAQKRQTDILLPSYLRPLVAIGNLYPPLGDWLLLRFTK